jgi:ribosomal protein S12 methylthiotransferase
MDRYVYIVSLGCAKNLVDTELAAGSLAVNGIGFADDPETADIYFINTCAFISPAREEAEQFIREAVKWKRAADGRKIIIGGCLTQWDEKCEFRRKYPSIDLWIPVDEAENLAEHIASLYVDNQKKNRDIAVSTPKSLYNENTPRLQLTPAHFAYLKIADGCNNNCSYCAIPGIRGQLRNRPAVSIIKEAENLIKNGVKEIILAAQDTTVYSDPETSEDLADLIQKLDSLQGDFQIRLLYAHPAHLKDNMIKLFKTSKHLIPYIDLPLQHISDHILKSMNRNINACEIRRKITELRKANPEIAIRTTFLVGYPGETEDDFNELCNFIREIKFTRLGVFPYCTEDRTRAANLPNHVPTEIAQERCDHIMLIQSEISLEHNKSLIGKTLTVIVDDIYDDCAMARTCMDAPEIDNIVEITDGQNLSPGENVKVTITAATEFQLNAKLFL